MLRGILCSCKRTSYSVNIARSYSKCSIHTIQKFRNVSTATTDLFSNTNVHRKEKKSDDWQPNTSVAAESNKDDIDPITPKISLWNQFSSKKYEKFVDSSNIIYDFNEEQRRLEENLAVQEQEKLKEEIHLERGVTGVFDIEEFVDLLKEENAVNIAVIRIPERMKYVEYMVIASCKSQRHMSSMAQFIRKIYKKKKHASDKPCIMEGKNTGWVALDMGNIAVHLMEPELREAYDIETLWTVGAEFDEKCQLENNNDPLNLINLNVQHSESALESQKNS